ncbi:DUF6708 domain-containing protein [Acinetobacter bereziniae]|uniref:DUF6708 domain-containing protein n=1 Tax=Acinetobacter bereziniae TaxID=106648 RepID=UPI00190076ED|nr:DUF6708 domain-containing protein [Acinetobacter bereziniae]MBJ9905233.1 hypothetical protein [Acinetobacter bereziniae]MCU4601528.1 hypothetical protein [Acinetobacter bereziniae]
MKSKIKKHVFGYDVFKENIPFSKLDEGDVLLTPHDEFKRNHNWSFLSMNDDYIELIDQNYARLGKSLSMFVFISPLIILLFCILFFILFYPVNDKGWFIYGFILFSNIFLICFILYSFLSPYFKYDHNKPLCKPILFNRKTGKVFFYLTDAEYIERDWKDVVYVMGTSFGLSGFTLRELRAHIVEDGLLKHTFVIGFPMIGWDNTQGLWSFICHFMHKGPAELYPKPNPMYGTIDPFTQLTFCQQLIGAKESYRDTWKSFRIIYHDNWVPALFSYPFDVCNFIARRILLNIKPLPVWHKEVILKNKMEQQRPEEISFKDNFEFTMFEMKDK